jgi:hypothetical protein
MRLDFCVKKELGGLMGHISLPLVGCLLINLLLVDCLRLSSCRDSNFRAQLEKKKKNLLLSHEYHEPMHFLIMK